MKPPFSLVLVHGDGTRVLRLCVPRWIAWAALGSLAAVATCMAGLSSDWALLRRERGQMTALRDHMEDQRVRVESFRKRAAEIGNEIVAWRSLHARMWDAFGPATASGGTETSATAAGSGDELERLASLVREEAPRLQELEHMITRTGRLIDALPLRWPVRGQVKSEYGLRQSPWNGAVERHEGIDIGSPPGTPVECPAGGTVVAASSGGDYGKHLTLDHGNGVRSRYGHLKKVDVKLGETVEKGQVIGLVGSTGKSTGPHLHYEVLVDGKPTNPRGFLWER